MTLETRPRPNRGQRARPKELWPAALGVEVQTQGAVDHVAEQFGIGRCERSREVLDLTSPVELLAALATGEVPNVAAELIRVLAMKVKHERPGLGVEKRAVCVGFLKECRIADEFVELNQSSLVDEGLKLDVTDGRGAGSRAERLTKVRKTHLVNAVQRCVRDVWSNLELTRQPLHEPRRIGCTARVSAKVKQYLMSGLMSQYETIETPYNRVTLSAPDHQVTGKFIRLGSPRWRRVWVPCHAREAILGRRDALRNQLNLRQVQRVKESRDVGRGQVEPGDIRIHAKSRSIGLVSLKFVEKKDR